MKSLPQLLSDPKYRKLPRKVLRVLDGHAMAIFRLKVHGIISEQEQMQAWMRLVALTKREIKAHHKP